MDHDQLNDRLALALLAELADMRKALEAGRCTVALCHYQRHLGEAEALAGVPASGPASVADFPVCSACPFAGRA